MQSAPIDVDIAKSIFKIHSFDPDRAEIVTRTLKRAQVPWVPCQLQAVPCQDGCLRRSPPPGLSA